MTVVHWPIIGVSPSWVTHSSLSPDQSPTPSSTAKAAGEPSVQVLHRARMADSLVGSKLAMMGLIFRPLMPPALLIWLTKSWMALVCSPYSASLANPILPASEVSATTGSTRLMVCWVTPREDVLAWPTGVGPEPVEPDDPSPDAAAVGVLEGAAATQATAPTTMAPTMASVRSWVERGRRTK